MLELQEEFSNIQFRKVDVEKEQALAAEYGVKSLPTVLFFKNGKLEETLIGYRPRNQYHQEIKRLQS